MYANSCVYLLQLEIEKLSSHHRPSFQRDVVRDSQETGGDIKIVVSIIFICCVQTVSVQNPDLGLKLQRQIDGFDSLQLDTESRSTD